MLTIFRERTPSPMGFHTNHTPQTLGQTIIGGGGVQKRHFHTVVDPPLFSHCLRCANVWLCNGVVVDRERERESDGTREAGRRRRRRRGQRVDPCGSGATSSESSGLCRRFVLRVPTDRLFTARPALIYATRSLLLCSPVSVVRSAARPWPLADHRCWPSSRPCATTQQTTALTPSRSGSSCRDERKNLL